MKKERAEKKSKLIEALDAIRDLEREEDSYEATRCKENHFFGAFRYHPNWKQSESPVDAAMLRILGKEEPKPHFFGAFFYDPIMREQLQEEKKPQTEKHHATEKIIKRISLRVERLTKTIAQSVYDTDEPATFTITCKLEPPKKSGSLPIFGIASKTTLNDPTEIRQVRIFDDQMTFPFEE